MPLSIPPALRWVLYPILVIVGFAVIGLSLAIIAITSAYPNLPSLDAVTDYRPKIPLRVYTADGHLIGEFGEERRAVVRINDVPEVLKHAILAAEDDRFYQHGGVDTVGVLRAAYNNLVSGGRRQGASTITMQVARNFFLSRDKKYSRKFYEALLSFEIERTLSKDQILELYINQIFLGQRAYGFAAAAQIYFGKSLKELTPAEAAMLAGLPQSPSTKNPIVNPKGAKKRQQYVLQRMNLFGWLTNEQYQAALQEPIIIKRDASGMAPHAEYVAEMARQIAVERFSDSAYTRGLRVYTTITQAEQEAAYQSMRRNMFNYDQRHGYRGAEAYVSLQGVDTTQEEALDELLQNFNASDDLYPAIVLSAAPGEVRAYKRGEFLTITGDGLKFAAKMLDAKSPSDKRLRPGAIIRIQKDTAKNKKGVETSFWKISQMPTAESAFVAVDPYSGAVRALVGGFDFDRNKFNHVTQAWRQPGSSFKPFIYSASLEKGFTPASIIEDEPIVISSAVTGSQAWQPKNYDGKYDGPMRMRTALARSKNMVSIRILQAIGTRYAQDYVTRFGFDADKHPAYLTMALGAGSVTPWQMASAYAVFANGGYRIQPYIVQEIQDNQKNVLARAQPTPPGNEELRAIDPRNAFLMDSMLRDVTIYGTAGRASATLKRRDLAGKTGTTNEHVDAWFCGYQQTQVGCAWIGFDQPHNLGRGETGGTAALPIWISYMTTALKDVPQTFQKQPEGLVAVDAYGDHGKGPQRELFYKENIPATLPPDPHDPLQDDEDPETDAGPGVGAGTGARTTNTNAEREAQQEALRLMQLR